LMEIYSDKTLLFIKPPKIYARTDARQIIQLRCPHCGLQVEI